MDLVQVIMKQLGIDEQQAKGGLGLIFELVKGKLGVQDFQQVARLVPGIEELIKAAPSADSSGGGLLGMVGSLASQLTGGKLGDLGTLAELAAGFDKLGLQPDKIAQFVPVVLKFIEEQGGTTVKNLLNQVLKA